VRLNTTATHVRMEDGERVVDLVSDDYHSTIRVDAILTGVGRRPNVQGMALEAAGVAYDETAGITVDDQLRTANPRIYAAGDVCLEARFTDIAIESAHIVVRNALLGGRERLSERIVPWCTYTDPEIAHVGMYVREANARGIPIKTFTIPMHQVDRAITDSEQGGFVKLHVSEGSDHILGATIVSRDAGDMISQVTLAMVAGVGLRTLAKVIHAYPTKTEAIREAALAYNRTRITPRVIARLRRWLAR
jgi:pyruvate/2-oxoglutarate dehydrogenase complex dihydrolipoamide dehydrogenase (E3) component